MKFIILSTCLMLFSIQNNFASTQLHTFFEDANHFFANYVINGAIDFEDTQMDEHLQHLIEQIKESDISQSDSLTQLAFLINAYNLHALHEIKKLLPLNHTVYYNDFFHKTIIEVAGEKFTFNQLINERLVFIATNPLFHFALIQAGLSFPMLPNHAFSPNQLHEQLENQTQQVINHPHFLRRERHKVTLPKFLKWYKKELIGKKNSILRFLNNYYPLKDKELKLIRTIKYDKVSNWTLNYYIQALKSNADTIAIKSYFNRQFNLYKPAALLKPRSIELQSLNNTTQNERYGVSPNVQYRTRSIAGKIGINQSLNIGVIYNYSYSEANTFGPQLWVMPLKKHQNFIIEFNALLPLFQTQLNDFHSGIDVMNTGHSLYTKFKYWYASSIAYVDFDIGISLEKSYTYTYYYENLNMIALPVNFSGHIYMGKHFRLHTKFSYSPYKRKYIFENNIKGNMMFNQTGLSIRVSKIAEISLLFGFFRNKFKQTDLRKTIEKRNEKWQDFNIDFRFTF